MARGNEGNESFALFHVGWGFIVYKTEQVVGVLSQPAQVKATDVFDFMHDIPTDQLVGHVQHFMVGRTLVRIARM